MAKNTGNKKLRPIRFDQFAQQLEEVGIGNLQEVQLSKTESVYVRLGNGIDAEDHDDFMARIRGSQDSEEVAKVVLDYYPPSEDPEEYEDWERGEAQWAIFEKHGGTADKLAALWNAATTDQKERLGELRPRRS